MPEITRQRMGLFLRFICELLMDKPDGLPAKDILDLIPKSIPLNEFESGYYPSNPNTPRYQKLIRFGTIDLVKAGWLVKNKGRWFITEEGKLAYNKFTDPEKFYKEAARLYHEWRKSRPHEDEIDITEAEESPKAAVTVEEAEELAWVQIQEYLQNMPPYDFQELVADLLRAMDYHVAWVAPPGKDRGIDIIAYTDPLGANVPRIKVQVKRRDQPTNVEGLRSFMSVLGTDDLGLFVASGGFTSDAKEEARTQERRKITLIDLEDLFDLWVEHYPKLTQEATQRLPLKPIYFLAPSE
ncbi:MAG TPA: restriction endonuclease [Anaerolineales bacterium]|nr:restriction endonuclease [Anaerolineales bacterium]